MPRGKHGGARTGTPGVAYSQRTDLHQTVPGQQYGAAADQQRSMAAVPMQRQAAPAPVAPAGQPTGVQAPGQQTGPTLPDGSLHPDMLAGISTPPGATDPLRATDSPDQPVTHGSPSGPGAGAESWTPPPPPRPETQALALLQQVPPNVQSDQVRRIIAGLHASTLNEMAP